MVNFSPLPRMRLYTSMGNYFKIFTRFVTGRVTLGDEVSRLEAAVAKRVGARYAVAMPRARVGIYFTLKALIKPGQEVLLSPYGIADVVNMVVCAGGVPVFADLDSGTCNISADEVERLINENTGAVIATHFYGMICDVVRIARICEMKGVPLIEDSAQAFGARLDGKAAGTTGLAGIYSFGLYKNVNSFFGGMVVTDDVKLRDSLIQYIKNLPYQSKWGLFRVVISGVVTDFATWPLLYRIFTFPVLRYGFLNNIDKINNKVKIDVNPELKSEIPKQELCRMTPLQASLSLAQFDDVECLTARRIAAAERYHEGLKNIEQIGLPPLCTDGSHIYWYYPIHYSQRHELVRFAMQRGSDIAESYHRNCADLNCFREFSRDCKNAKMTAESIIYLPTYPRFTDREIDKVIATIKQYFGAIGD